MGLALGMSAPNASPSAVVHVEDVARIHVGALDEEKVLVSADFLASIPARFKDVLEIARRLLPEWCEIGGCRLGGRGLTRLLFWAA
jgi:hypothetical protein